MICAPLVASSLTILAPIPDVPPCQYQCNSRDAEHKAHRYQHHLPMHIPLRRAFCTTKIRLEKVDECNKQNAFDDRGEVWYVCDASSNSFCQQRNDHDVDGSKGAGRPVESFSRLSEHGWETSGTIYRQQQSPSQKLDLFRR